MNPDDVANVLDEIGRRVGPLGQQTAEILVRGTFAESLVFTAVGVFLLLLALVAMVFAIIGFSKNHDDMFFIALMAFFLFGIPAFVLICANAVGVFAPDYIAIKHLLEAIAGPAAR